MITAGSGSLNADPKTRLVAPVTSYDSTAQTAELAVMVPVHSAEEKIGVPQTSEDQEYKEVPVDAEGQEDDESEDESADDAIGNALAQSRLDAPKRGPFPASDASSASWLLAGNVAGFTSQPNEVQTPIESYATANFAVASTVCAFTHIKRTQINAKSLNDLYLEVEGLRLTVVALKQQVQERVRTAESKPIVDKKGLAKASAAFHYGAAPATSAAGGGLGYLISGKPAIAVGALIGWGIWGCITGCRRHTKANKQKDEIERLKYLRGEFEVTIARLRPIVMQSQQNAEPAQVRQRHVVA